MCGVQAIFNASIRIEGENYSLLMSNVEIFSRVDIHHPPLINQVFIHAVNNLSPVFVSPIENCTFAARRTHCFSQAQARKEKGTRDAYKTICFLARRGLRMNLRVRKVTGVSAMMCVCFVGKKKQVLTKREHTHRGLSLEVAWGRSIEIAHRTEYFGDFVRAASHVGSNARLGPGG